MAAADLFWLMLIVASASYLVYWWLGSRRASPSADRAKTQGTERGKARETAADRPKTRGTERGKARETAADRPKASARSASGAPEAPREKKDAEAARDSAAPRVPVISSDDEEDADVEATRVGEVARTSVSPPTLRIVYDEDAEFDEPTHVKDLILVTASAQTDRGRRRKNNEDSLLVSEDEGLFVVADGMGGYSGGELASSLAVQTIEEAFRERSFAGAPHDTIPPRASELARAIQMANEAILDRASGDKLLDGMGTTICAARFAPNKQRLYVGHVGDSRAYCLREGELRQMTSDHTMKDFGVEGPGAAHLSRAVGIWPTVPIDIVLGKPRAGDVYLFCSDGLTKMVPDDAIAEVLRSEEPQGAVDRLIEAANANGGKDNVTVVVVRVSEPPPLPPASTRGDGQAVASA